MNYIIINVTVHLCHWYFSNRYGLSILGPVSKRVVNVESPSVKPDVIVHFFKQSIVSNSSTLSFVSSLPSYNQCVIDLTR